MPNRKTRIDTLEKQIKPDAPTDPAFLRFFEVCINPHWDKPVHCIALDDALLPLGMHFGFDAWLAKFIADIRKQGGDAAIIFDPAYCERTIETFRPKHNPNTPEREAEWREYAERIKVNVESPTLEILEYSRKMCDATFLSELKEWQKQNETRTQTA